MSFDNLGDRMKAYEEAARTTLPGRLPVIIRVDGKAFHTYTRGADRPFDFNLSSVMTDVATKLCEQIQGAQLAYIQSDEISVLVHGYKTFASQPWFDNQVQKMTSVAAGIASAHFTSNSWKIWRDKTPTEDRLGTARAPGMQDIRPAVFDARVFVVPETDVCNYFLWRQKDAIRNSIQTLARLLYSQKQLHGKSSAEMLEMCDQRGVAWSTIPLRFQRGLCVYRELREVPGPGPRVGTPAYRMSWQIDAEIPLFNEDRAYVNDLLKVEEQ